MCSVTSIIVLGSEAPAGEKTMKGAKKFAARRGTSWSPKPTAAGDSPFRPGNS